MEYHNEFTPLQKQWLEALESGGYKQCRDYLRDGGGFCCLGVATHVVNPEHPAIELDGGQQSKGSYDYGQVAPKDIVAAMNFRGECGSIDGRRLTSMNDDGSTFAEIAAEIRKRPWWVFTNFDQP